MYETYHLDPAFKYLPYCAHIEEIDDPAHPGKKLKKISYFRTYPAYPWKLGEGIDHSKEDPVKFINICAHEGLVKWETAQEKADRLERERKENGGMGFMPYSEYLIEQELINNMPLE